MVRALRKIERNATFDVPSRMEAFFIENPVSNRLTGLLATHPSIEDRVEALQRFAGAADVEHHRPRTDGASRLSIRSP